jgi:acetyl-CoA carboxylase carboxyl transferase subunit beta
MRNLFRRRSPSDPDGPGNGKSIPEDMWVRCTRCRELLYTREWENNFKVCLKCGYHDRLSAPERIRLLLDADSFQEESAAMRSGDPLGFAPPGRPPYVAKLTSEVERSGAREAAIYGRATLDSLPVVFAMLDMNYFVGTLGSVVGEKITRACELAVAERRPLVVCSASGGARQEEGVIALLQMAKTVAAVNALAPARVPFVSILTDPTLAGVTASFAALGDCVIAEPGAVVGFAGPRIIQQTIGERLPPGTDTAEFQYRHGMVDLVVPRRELRDTVARLLRLYQDAATRSLEPRSLAPRRELVATAAG